MKKDIYDLIKDKNEHVSFAQMQKYIPGFEGEYSFGKGEYNIWFWFNCSWEATIALKSLMGKGKIHIHPTEALVYYVDGLVPDVPIATSDRNYKEERWLPVTICTYPWEEQGI